MATQLDYENDVNYIDHGDYDDYDEYDDAMTDFHSTALHDAVLSGNASGVHTVLDGGFDIHTRDGQGRDALQLASGIKGASNIVQLLLSRGANVNAKPLVHSSSRTEVVGSGEMDDLQLLLEHCGIDDLPDFGFGPENPLLSAAAVGESEIVRLLIQYGADVNIKGGMYGNPLEAAAHYGDKSTVLILLNAGADVNASGGYHGNALQAAARYGRLELVQILLDKGADVNAQGGVYTNALTSARERGHVEVEQLLVSKGAS